MKRWRSPTVRAMLVLLVMSCLLPAAIMTALSTYQAYQRERAQLTRDLIATARALTLAVDRDLASVQAALLTLATSPYLAAGDLAAFYAQAKEVLHDQFANNVVLSDVSGQQRLNTLRPFGAALPRHGNMTQMQRVIQTGRPLVSDIYIGAVAKRPLVGIDVPVWRGHAVVYVLSMGIFPERLSKILVEQRLPSSWVVVILDRTGRIVSRTHKMESYVGKNAAPALVERIGQMREGSVETDTVEGIPVLAVFSRSASVDWTVAIGVPKAELEDQLRRSFGWLVLVLVLLLAASVGLALAVAGVVIRAFGGLSDPALALGYGETVKVPPLGLREADAVGSALERASTLLQQAQYSAQHDALTGLANRALFDEIVNQQVALCRRTVTKLAVLYVDLDDFKPVNDRHGHAVGDTLLREVATRLASCIRQSDVAARLGGDEFAVALSQTGKDEALLVARNLVETLSAAYAVGTLSLKISASIGVAVYPDTAGSSEDLLRQADRAMYDAKFEGKQRYVVAAKAGNGAP